MALNLTVLIMVLAITFMHSIFGFFSGLINLFCTIAAVAVSLGFYEALNDVLTDNFAGEYTPYTEPICVIVLFIITLAVLRTLADNYIRGNVKLPVAVDWTGASICGLLNAQLFVGMMVICVTLLPIGGRVLGYSAWARSDIDERDPDHPEIIRYERNHLWTRSDEFTAGLFSWLSRGSMRGATVFASVYPDFPEAIFFSTNTVQAESSPVAYRAERGQKRDGWAQGLRVEGWWEEHDPIEARYRAEEPTSRTPTPRYDRVVMNPAPGKKWLVTQLLLDSSAADRDNRTMKHLFRPTTLRLVGQTTGGAPQQYVPLILANTDPQLQGSQRVVNADTNTSLSADRETRVYAYYEVDQDFDPAFVEYRRHARAPLGASPMENPRVVLSLGEHAGDGGRQSADAGRTFGSVLEGGSGQNIRLPIVMNRQTLQGAGDVTLQDGKYASGRAFGSLSRLTAGEGQPAVQDFFIPTNRRLIQIKYKPRRINSIVSQVFNYVGQLNNYFIVDSTAEKYPMAGYYAVVTRGNERYIEIYYTGADTPESAANRSMLDFRNIERNELNDLEDSEIGMLFLVPPNRSLVRLENQAGEGGDINMRSSE